jgi:hypothetical protein
MLVILFCSAAHSRSFTKSLFLTGVCALLAVLLTLMWTRHVNVLLLRKAITYKVIQSNTIILYTYLAFWVSIWKMDYISVQGLE